jgi:hypothetical protein
METTTPTRLARVLHTVTIEFDVDLDGRRVCQVLVDHTVPLRVEEEDEGSPPLTNEERRTALDIVVNSAEAWPAWALAPEECFNPPSEPELQPPFDFG